MLKPRSNDRPIIRDDRQQTLRVLIPFNAQEAMSLKEAAVIAGRSEATVRSWCALNDIGRRVGGGTWRVSRVALAMFLDNDVKALRAYHAGDRESPVVVGYFLRAGL